MGKNIEAADMNNGDIINDYVILSLEDGKGLDEENVQEDV